MEENKNTSVKSSIFSRYAYYFIFGAILLCIVLAITLTVVFKSNNEPAKEVNTGSVEFVVPVANATILKGYNANQLQYNQTLNEWAIHKAIDFSVSSGANVLACYDGEVESVSTNLIDGTVITINHGNNLKTVYKSLAENVEVKVGDTVTAGQVIGKASASATGETSDSSQVHFEVWKDDALVDPAGYLDMGEK